MALSEEQKERLTDIWTRAVDNDPNADNAIEGIVITYEDGTHEPATPRSLMETGLADGSLHALVEQWLDNHPEETFEGVCEALEASNGNRLKL